MTSLPNKLASIALLALLLAACGGGESSPDDPPSGNTPPPPGTTPPPAPQPENNPPTISGTPPGTATVGVQWSFQPAIHDPDGDPLTVTVQNRPGWINVNASTGLLTGTPAEGDLRTWSNVRVSVTDGEATASLPLFSIVVSAAGAPTGSATLSWSPPTERTDGSPVGQLAGYRVLYGQSSGQYDTVVTINNAGITTYMIEGLGAGTWYFAVKAMTTDGLMSELSPEVSKTI